MWTLFLALSLTVGLAALAAGFFADGRGWESLSRFATFLMGWLPATSVLCLLILCKSGWRWSSIAGVVILLAGIQWGALVLTGDSRWTICFMPCVLVCLSAAALLEPAAPPWLQPAAPWFALLGLIAIAGAFGLRSRERSRQNQQLESFRLRQAQKDATAHGLQRAAWLLASEFTSLDGYSEAEFVRTRRFLAPRPAGEYRWDEARQRLRVTRALFGDFSPVRSRILPVAAALESPALLSGLRAQFGGATLACRPPLDCTMVWELDVEPLHPDARPLRGALDAWVTELEISVQKAVFGPSR